MSGLSERDMRILAFERRGWRSPGVKEQAIAEVLDMPATRYYQLLNELIDRPEALAFDPVLVKRLRAQRARRQRMRSPRPKGTQGTARVTLPRPLPPDGPTPEGRAGPGRAARRPAARADRRGLRRHAGADRGPPA